MRDPVDCYLESGEDSELPNPLICPLCDADLIKAAVRKRRDKDPEFVERVRIRVGQDAELLRKLADS